MKRIKQVDLMRKYTKVRTSYYKLNNNYGEVMSQGKTSLILPLFCLLMLTLNKAAITATPSDTNKIKMAWERQFTEFRYFYPNERDFDVDRLGNVYVTGRMDMSPLFTPKYFVTIKYNTDGEQEWAILYDKILSNYSDSFRIKADKEGNVYVGAVYSGNSLKTIVVKYNPEGNTIWSAVYDSTTAGSKRGTDFAIDDSGNVYVSAVRYIDSIYDYLLLKFNNNGILEWAKTLYPAPSPQVVHNKIALDNEGNIYTCVASSPRFALLKYNNSGEFQWSVPVSIYIENIRVDNKGGIYVYGSDNGAVLIKYNANGQQQRIYKDSLSGSAQDFCFYNNNSYLIEDSNTGIVTIKFDSTGQEKWRVSYRHTSNSQDWSRSIAVDDAGNIYVCGTSSENGVYPVLIKYNQDGLKIDDFLFNVNNGGGIPIGAKTNNNNIYVSWIANYLTTTKFVQDTVVPVELISFHAIPNKKFIELKWSTATETNNKGFEIQRSEKAGRQPNQQAGSIWEKIGFIEGYGTTTESKIYSYTDQNVSPGSYYYRLKQIDFDGTYEYSKEIEVIVGLPQKFNLAQNYPNPFNPVTKIKYELPEAVSVNLVVYNILGEVIQTLVNERKEAGTYEIEFNSSNLNSGVYFYKIITDKYSEVRKMMVVK